MESEISITSHLPVGLHRLLPGLIPALLISVGYIDPGKWAATVEGGARFGFDLALSMLIFNFAAIVCQYLSARIGVVTKRDLAEICSNEYDRFICILLGVQMEFSMIALDLSLIVGMAHGLNLLLGVDLFSCIFLTAIDGLFYPLFANLLENCKAKLLCICIACFVILASAIGVLLSQAEIPLSMNGVPTKLSGESAFMLMSLLGASILPQNFYLHSALVQQYPGEPIISSGSLCHDHFFAIISVFSCIYLASYVLLNSAANVFYSAGLVLLTFQDALTLVEQVFRSSVAPFLLLILLLCASQATALTWNLSGEVILHNFLRVDIPSWLHRSSIRIFAIIPAIYCAWNSGAEGLYQLLILTQVIVALLLPSSVIPLFRVASSRPLMGVHKISQFLEFLVLIVFIGMLGLKIIFVVEMIFGSSDWAGNLRWSIGSSSPYPFVILLITAFVSLGLMLWLAATPLKSASSQMNAQAWNRDLQPTHEYPAEKEQSDFDGVRYSPEEHVQRQDAFPLPGKSHVFASTVALDADSTEIESDRECLLPIEEKQSSISMPGSRICCSEQVVSVTQSIPVLSESKEIPETNITKVHMNEPVEPVEKTVGVEVNLKIKRDDGEEDMWEHEEQLPKGVSGSTPSPAPEPSGSLRSLSGKSDEGGNGAGSLSRLAGLGRAARRQVAQILDEFWGQIYDFHGQATQDAKSRKFDVLLGADIKVSASSMKTDMSGSEPSAYYTSLGGRGSDAFTSSSMLDSPRQQRVQSCLESPYGVQRGSPALRSQQMQPLDAYIRNSNRGVLDSGERRYSSLRLPPSSEAWDNPPATVHGYQIASYLNRVAAERNSDCFSAQGELPFSKSMSLVPTSYKDSNAFSLGQKLQNGLSPFPASFRNAGVSRDTVVDQETSYYEHFSPLPSSNAVSSANEKRYRSMPDISGVSIYNRDLGMSPKNTQWDNSVGFGPSISNRGYEPSVLLNSGSRLGPLVFDDLSPSGNYRDTMSMQLTSNSDTSSLWSRQPFEQFGVAGKGRNLGSIGSRPCAVSGEVTSVVDSEAVLLQSFRHCILKLLKLEGSDWLFKQNEGADEDLIDKVAAREKFLSEVENRERNRGVHMVEPQGLSYERKPNAPLKNEELYSANLLVPSVPHCGDDCIWRADLIVSFGVWCIHKILDLSLMESRPELWGKYTYVLNRLQGIIDPAFSKPRSPMSPCFCLQITGVNFQQTPSYVAAGNNGTLSPASKAAARAKCTTAVMLLEIIKDVEVAISGRKGRTGTAAGDVAFPKGKENLASVLKRYKRRLSNKPIGSHEGVSTRKIPPSASYGS